MKSAALTNPTTKPYRLPNRTIQLRPNSSIMLAEAFPKLKAITPTTRLGKIGLDLAAQTAVSVVSVAAISSYINAITNAELPEVSFVGTPPAGLNNQQLQAAYNDFLTQFNSLKDQADAWFQTSPTTPDIFSQMVGIPAELSKNNADIQSYFTDLANLDPNSSNYTEILNDLTNQLSAFQPGISSLVAQMTNLGNALQTGSEALVTAASTGILAQLIDVYHTEIENLNTSIQQSQASVAEDESQLLAAKIGTASSVTMGVIGLVNIWNPAGWVIIGGSVLGATSSISNLESLKGKISELNAQIQQNQIWATTDGAAAGSVSAFSNEVSGFSSLNTAAQRELNALETLFQSLDSDPTAALTNLSASELSLALNEWNEALEAAAFLGDLTAYTWPGPPQLINPTAITATGQQLYAIDVAGDLYTWTKGDTTWTAIPGKTLSAVASFTFVVGIDGVPAVAPTTQGTSPAPTFYAKVFNFIQNAWTTLSTFPVAQITTDGASIYCIQQGGNRSVMQHASGTSWNALPPLPNGDVTTQIVLVAGTLFALTARSQTIYAYAPGAWLPAFEQTCGTIAGNGDVLSAIGTDGTVYSFAVTTTGFQSLQLGNSGAMSAPLTDGSQYIINSNLQLQLLEQGTPANTLKNDATGCFASDIDQVYYTNNQGTLYRLEQQEPYIWAALPNLPS